MVTYSHRMLLLDGIRQQLIDPIILLSPKELDDLVEKYSVLQDPPNLTIDLRSLPQVHFNSLLKFIEDYRGGLTIVANDSPISSAMLSRFTSVEKNPNIDENLTDMRYIKVTKGGLMMTNAMKTKILDFLDINIKDVDLADKMFADENGYGSFDNEDYDNDRFD